MMGSVLPKTANGNGSDEGSSSTGGFLSWLKRLFKSGNGENSARDVLEELIEEREVGEVPIDDEERLLLANILELKDRTIHDVMVPRADIISIESENNLSNVIELITREGHSRMPVFRGALDDAIGMIHIKDVLAWHGRDSEFALRDIVRKVLFVPPSMQVLELLLEMRAARCHMALVVDEYGGIDGLVTIEDLVEEIVGEIEDEHDRTEEPIMVDDPNGTLIADARVTVEMLEERLGVRIGEEEREDIDTLGGLVFSLAGRVPVRGELISHPSGLEFEILDADPRRIKRLRLREIGKISNSLRVESQD
jgi:CBS domain containing-hemolysin-like protein